MNVGMISLGCSKNQVDSEMMLGSLTKAGINITTSVEESDIIIINTCAFIESAKEEALFEIEDIISEIRDDQKLVVTGCFAERYKEYLTSNYPRIDLVIPIHEYKNFNELINKLINSNIQEGLLFNNRVLVSSPYSPYVRIADGCNNHCAFCAIPLIRGKYISRRIEDIIDEAKELVKNGAKEINIIAQDVSKYGVDLYHKMMLPDLLRELEKIDGIFLIRLYYLYPETITDELIELIKNSKVIAHYFDMPLQHSSNSVLKRMNRHSTSESQRELIKRIRKEIPDAIIRTTLMVGFPGETDEDFNELLDFVRESKFFHMGAFMYSKEEDTESYDMDNQVPDSIKEERYDKLMSEQMEISTELKKELIGRTYDAIIDSYDEESYSFSARSYMFMSDDVDSFIICYCPFENNIKEGDIVRVKIIDSTEYELIGTIEEVYNE